MVIKARFQEFKSYTFVSFLNLKRVLRKLDFEKKVEENERQNNYLSSTRCYCNILLHYCNNYIFLQYCWCNSNVINCEKTSIENRNYCRIKHDYWNPWTKHFTMADRDDVKVHTTDAGFIKKSVALTKTALAYGSNPSKVIFSCYGWSLKLTL